MALVSVIRFVCLLHQVPLQYGNTIYLFYELFLNQRREDVKKKYEMFQRLKYLKSIGHIFMNVTNLVDEGSNNNGQDIKVKAKP